MSFVVRHRFVIWDSGIFLAAAGLIVFLALEYSFLGQLGFSDAEAAGIELAEVVLIALGLGGYLLITIRRMRAQHREVELRRAAEQRAHELAFRDPLTGLANRRQFDKAVARAVEEPPSAERTHAVLLLDLNGFKSINDVFGHPTGDLVLQEVGLRLVGISRESGHQIARLGGDEFGIVATHLMGSEDASGLAWRAIETLSIPVQVGATEHTIGAGVGIALFPRDGKTAEEIVRRADVALYRAKLELRSNLRFFEEEMDVQVRERAMIETELRRAIAVGQIEPYYQPIVELGTERVVGFEALARWHHPTLGDVPPERFIPIAEGSGLIRELSERLLRTACVQACRWPAGTMLSFNVSPVELRDPAFGLRVLSILGESGLSPDRLELEITENTLVRDLSSAEEALGSLRAAGVRIALDDFGTGYSSLYHLRKFKIDRIKIDRSFVEAMMREDQSAAIIRAMLGLGHGLGVQITAEGIETTTQREALIGEGCGQGQGFLFSRALPAAETEALFAQKSLPETHSTAQAPSSERP